MEGSQSPMALRDGRGVQSAPADESTCGGASRTRELRKDACDLVLSWRSWTRRYKTCSDWTEPGGRNAPQPLLLRSQELSPAPRAISRHVRSDKGAQSTPSPKAAAAPLDAMAQHWLLATLVATALALVPPATTAPGLTKLSAYVPSGPSRRTTQISRRFKLRPRPRRGLHAVDAAPARRRGAAVL